MKQETEAERQRRELIRRQEALRLLEEQRSTAENILLNSAVDMREFIAMRKTLPKRVERPDLPRDQMNRRGLLPRQKARHGPPGPQDKVMDEKQVDALARFHREREEWQREQQKLRQKAEAEWLDGSRDMRYPGARTNAARIPKMTCVDWPFALAVLRALASSALSSPASCPRSFVTPGNV
jgi:hypothetical protein